MAKPKKKLPPNTIATNRRARFDYLIEDTIEAGIQLQGWEVKAIRAGQVTISESFVLIRSNEVWMMNSQINPLTQASSHKVNEAHRQRKLLLHRKQIDKLAGLPSPYVMFPLDMYWKGPFVKVKFGFGKPKKLHDKRDTVKDREWKIQKARLMKSNNR